MNIILYELNEVPWRIMDWYCDRNPKSAFAHLRGIGRDYETHTEDRGELHPWVTWPSVHRGVADGTHGIAHLGQDLREVDAAYPPLWTLLAQHGVRVGIGGSLHSYPVPADPHNYAFYVPDTFAGGPETIPPALSSYQELSLKLTRQNSRNVSADSGGLALKLARSLPSLGVTARTMREIGTQLVRERTDKTRLNRRRAMQSALYFDIYMKQLAVTRPGFSTYFTNHVAASLHRFWAATFPSDYAHFALPPSWMKSYAHEIEWAMSIADGFARRLMRFCERNPDYRLVVTSSMGQSATTAEIRTGIWQLKNLARFFSILDVAEHEYRESLAMAPAISAHLLTDHALGRVRAAMPDIARSIGAMNWDIDGRNMLHVGIALEEDPERALPEIMIGKSVYTLEQAGLEFVPDQDRVATTAYHVPEGILMTWSPHDPPASGWTRPSISNLEIAPAILAAHGLAAPDYMKPSSFKLD